MDRLMPVMKSPEAFAVFKILSGPHQGKQLRLIGREIVIGRHSDCDIIMKNNKGCSRKHAKIKRTGGVYVIETLKADNPVFVNKKPVSSHVTLKNGDMVTIGEVVCSFLEKSPAAAVQSKGAAAAPSAFIKSKTLKEAGRKKNSKTLQKALIAAAGLIAAGLLLSEEDKKALQRQNIRTEQSIQEEMEALEKLTREEEERIEKFPVGAKEAQIAFIKGFRDFRKGYYQRAERHFEHCNALSQTYPLCSVYARKSRQRLERLIQRKMILGKEYREKRQYRSCIAAFQSVEIMIRDPGHAAFKEALKNRKLCRLKIQNQI